MTAPTGEWSALLPATQEISDICNQIKSEVESKSKRTFPEFFAYAFKHRQLLGGGTYVVKVYVGGGMSLVLTIEDMFTQAGNTYSLRSLMEGKNLYDPIEV